MKIKVIMCPADGRKPYVTNIENTLENMQKAVGGYIEAVKIASDAVVICNEEGRINNLPQNPCLPWNFRGDCFICGEDGEEFASLPEEVKKYWLDVVKRTWKARVEQGIGNRE